MNHIRNEKKTIFLSKMNIFSNKIEKNFRLILFYCFILFFCWHIIIPQFTILANETENDYDKSLQNTLDIKNKIQEQQNSLNNEINTAKKLKEKIDVLFPNDKLDIDVSFPNDKLDFTNLFHEVIQKIESKEPTALAKQFEQNVIELDSLTKEKKSFDQINSLKEKFEKLLKKYNEQLIKINKYNAKATQKLANNVKEKVEKIFDIIEIFLTPQDEKLMLTKEVRQDIINKEFDGALGSFQKGINSLISVEKETIIDKQIFSYNTAKFHFEEALKKYQNQNKLKKLFLYVLENKESQNLFNKKINIWNEEIKSQNNMIKWLYFFCIFDIFILILILIIIYIFYFCNKHKQKLKNKKDLS